MPASLWPNGAAVATADGGKQPTLPLMLAGHDPGMDRGIRAGRVYERVHYLDVLRVLSMLAVVLLHTVAGTLRSFYGSSQWHFSNVLTAVATASVPLFFMISGALLLSRPGTASVSYTLKKRVPRILIPFLVWSLIAIAYYAGVSWQIDGTPDWTAAIDKLKHLPARPTAIHLWFMYALIPLYILSPFIKRMVDGLDRSLVVYLLSIWVLFAGVLPTVAAFLPESYSSILVLDRRYDLSVMAGYAGYFVAGYYLMQWRRPLSKVLLGSVAVIDAACIALGTWWRTTALGEYAEVFKTYSGFFVLVLSCTLFLLFKEWLRERRPTRIGAAVTGFLAPLAFGVYLVHNLLVDLLSRVLPWWPATSVWMVVVSYCAVLAASVFVIWALVRIPGVRYVFAGQARVRRSEACVDVGSGPEAAGTEQPVREASARAEESDDEPTPSTATGAAQPGGDTTAPLPKVWRPETPKVKPPQPPGDTAERRRRNDWEI